MTDDVDYRAGLLAFAFSAIGWSAIALSVPGVVALDPAAFAWMGFGLAYALGSVGIYWAWPGFRFDFTRRPVFIMAMALAIAGFVADACLIIRLITMKGP